MLFYELLTGELPLGNFAPPSRMAEVDARLDDVVMRAMAKEPVRRYQQMSEMKDDLRAEPEAAPPAPPSPTIWFAEDVGFGVLTVFALIAAGVLIREAWPYLDQQALAVWLPFAILFGVVTPATGYLADGRGNRHARRFVSLIVLALGGWLVASVLTGGKVPGASAFGWSGWILCLIGVPVAASSLWASLTAPGAPEEQAGESEWVPIAVESTAAVTGLNDRQRALMGLLRGLSVPGLVVVPNINGPFLSAVREACEVSDDDRVLAVLNFVGGDSFDPDGLEAALVFGCEGLYGYNHDDGKEPGEWSISYGDLAGSNVVNHGTSVYAAGTHVEVGIDGEELTALLTAVRDVVRSWR